MVGMVKPQFQQGPQGLVFYPYPFLDGRVVPPELEDTIRRQAEWSRYAFLACILAAPLLVRRLASARDHMPSLLTYAAILAVYLLGYIIWVEFRTAGTRRVPRSSLRPRRLESPPGQLILAVVGMSGFFVMSIYFYLTRQGVPDAHPGRFLPGVMVSGLLLALVAWRRLRR